MTERKEAVRRLCKFPGCDRRHEALGWCKSHYRRWRVYGDPAAGKTIWWVGLKFFNNVVLPYDGDDCLVWPFARSRKGYATIYYNGNKMEAHRLACIKTYGPPPTPGHEAAHSCGKGHLGCVNPRHLSWKTPAENPKAKEFHGTILRGEDTGRAKLTNAQVREILSRRKEVRRKDWAAKYNVSPNTISNICTGRSWKCLHEPGDGE